MSNDFLEHFEGLSPVSFFALTGEILYGKRLPKKGRERELYLLGNAESLMYETPFAKVWAMWNEEGLTFEVLVKEAFTSCDFPKYEKGDAIEFFIDTRDHKAAATMGKFCHHFVVLPKPVGDAAVYEVTRFRTDDRHELMEGNQVESETIFGPEDDAYTIHVTFPSSVLHGYEPASFSRIGFAYTIRRASGHPQHLCAISDQIDFEKQPSTWMSLHLTK